MTRLKQTHDVATELAHAGSLRFLASSMELAAYLDGQYVEMHIATPDGSSVTVVCNRDSILKIERHIRDLAAECPQIGTW
jgi:hypothetical protein